SALRRGMKASPADWRRSRPAGTSPCTTVHRGSLFPFLDLDVLELHFHRRSRVELERDDTAEASRRVFHVDGFDAVQDQRDVVAPGGDLIVVPFAGLHLPDGLGSGPLDDEPL